MSYNRVACGLVVVVVIACNRNEPAQDLRSAKVEPPQSTATAQSSKVAPPLPTAGEPASSNVTAPGSDAMLLRRVTVREEGSARGVVARISRISPDEKQTYVSDTDQEGFAVLNHSCTTSDRFEVKPVLPVYLKVEHKRCAPELVFELISAQATYSLILLGNDAAQQKNFAQAQVFYTTAANRLQLSNPAEALLARNQANVALGKSLGIAEPTVNINGEEKLTAETRARLRVYQSTNGLAETGEFDEATSRSLSKLTSLDAIRRAQDVPPSRLEPFKLEPAVTKKLDFKVNDSERPENQYNIKAMTTVQPANTSTKPFNAKDIVRK